MCLKQIETVAKAVTGIGLLLLFAGLAFEFGWAKLAGLLVAAVGMTFSWVRLRCPHCKRHIQDTKEEVCAYCGQKIDYDAK